jgi:hypothetical protein
MAEPGEILSVHYVDESRKALEELSNKWTCEPVETARRLLSMGKFITDKLDDGSVFLIHNSDKSIERVHWTFDVPFPPELR